jgi:hypothetical protein
MRIKEDFVSFIWGGEKGLVERGGCCGEEGFFFKAHDV